MIEVLRIENLALVESVELEFGAGLNVLTGETGAGKSIILAALALLGGARATSDSLRSGADEGSVEALFRLDGHEDVVRALAERGLLDATEGTADAVDATSGEDEVSPSEDEVSGGEGEASGGRDAPELIVRRTLHAGGRSRARVGGQLVPVSTLAEVFGGQLEISSQHGSQALRHAEVHADALDAYANKTSLREIVTREVARVGELDRELATLRAAEEERARRLDFLEYQRQELDAEELDSEGVAALELEHRRLTHAERLAEEVGRASRALGGADGDDEGGSAESAIATARRALGAALRLDPSLESLAARLDALETELRDVAASAEDYAGSLEIDPERLADVEAKIARLEKLRRKYGQSVEAMFAHRDAVQAEIESLAGADERIRALEARREKAVEAANEASARLSKARRRAAGQLAQAVERELEGLAMGGARFVVELEAVVVDAGGGLETGPRGRERPEFRFSANTGEAPRPIQKVASGGELSRLFLALKNSLRRADRNMVIVFDEVDAGIGGAVAERVGRVLAGLAGEHQVLCITHLPQIAAFADRHFVVRKEARGGRTRTRVEVVDGDRRVDELARMAGGENVTDVTREHARALLRS